MKKKCNRKCNTLYRCNNHYCYTVTLVTPCSRVMEEFFLNTCQSSKCMYVNQPVIIRWYISKKSVTSVTAIFYTSKNAKKCYTESVTLSKSGFQKGVTTSCRHEV